LFEDRLMRGTLGHKEEGAIASSRKLHNDRLHNLYSSPNIIGMIKLRRMKWAGYVTRMGEIRNAYKISVGNPEGKRGICRPSRRWEDNVKLMLRKHDIRVCVCVVYIHMAKDTTVIG
jgi:hypothetical protein